MMRGSHEAIYTYLYVLPRGAFKRELARYLRRRHRFRRPRTIRLSSRTVQDIVSIDERLAEVADRAAFTAAMHAAIHEAATGTIVTLASRRTGRRQATATSKSLPLLRLAPPLRNPYSALSKSPTPPPLSTIPA
jgi:IS30 family transposase